MLTFALIIGKPYEGKLHVRFDEEVEETGKTRRLCFTLLIRNSLRYVSYKDMKSVASDLKVMYRAISLDQAEEELLIFSEKWDKKYPAISRSWHKNWSNIITIFDYPDEIRKIIYTTNAIGVPGESWLNKEVEFLSEEGLTTQSEPSFAFTVAI
ncbi:transposase [Candidatus Cardinium hertigii]|uniref:transposase n=1 Tax=Candidatus Cardinium hertigii TaxID=247481 RepID=UPI003D7CD4F7